MSLGNAEVERLARELAEHTGVTPTAATVAALRERLHQLKHRTRVLRLNGEPEADEPPPAPTLREPGNAPESASSPAVGDG